MEEDEENEALVGRSVRKIFQGFGQFEGEIACFDKARQYFKIDYADGDSEELERHEVRQILVPHSQVRKRAGGGRPRKNAAKRRKVGARELGDGAKQETVSESQKAAEQEMRASDSVAVASCSKLSGAEAEDIQVQDVSGSLPVPDDGAEAKDGGSVEAGLNIRPLPASSVKYDLSAESVLLLFSTYAFLRSFSLNIFLSPFSFEEFMQCLFLKEANALIDQIHLSLLLTLRQELEVLAKDGLESAAKCLRSRDWRLLDIVTWPYYLVTYLLTESFSKERQEKLADLAQVEYYTLEAGSKISMLSFLCDRVLDTDKLRSELAKRTNADFDMESTPLCATLVDNGEQQIRTRSSSKRVDGPTTESTPRAERHIPGQKQTPDWNSDDCVLCGVDGNLLCCDGCPAAYHSRCVGVLKAALPQGNWYCPECRLHGNPKGTKRPSKNLRAYELLGVDLHGRRYMTGCEHIFISKSSDIDSAYTCYTLSDVPAILKFLEADGCLTASLRQNLEDRIAGLNTELPDATKLETPGPCTTTEAGSELSESQNDRRSKRIQQKPQTLSPVKRDEAGKRYLGGSNLLPEPSMYVNHYTLGGFAAAAASCLSERTKKNADTSSAQKNLISDQLKAFCQVPLQFQWPSSKKRLTEASRERCGWCFPCKWLSRKKGCLLNTAAGKIAAGAAIVSGGLRPLKRGSNHFPSLAAYMLYMEDRLNGLLGGPWDSIDQRKHWKRSVERAENIQQLKVALIELGCSLRALALTRNWATVPEEAPRLPGTSNVCVSIPKYGRRRRRTKQVEVEETFWRRGGTVARKILDWESIPAATLKRAARQGGAKKISGLLYSDALEIPRKTAQCAWLTRVEASATVPEIAIQVRYLDALVRWSDLSLLDGACSIICSKVVEGNLVKYLVESPKTEDELRCHLKPQTISCASEFIRVVEGDSVERGNRIWLPETHLPLCLVRDFEEKWRCHMKAGKSIGVGRKVSKLPRTERFRKLIDKLMTPDVKPEVKQVLKCRLCDLEIRARLSVCCRKCEGLFHAYCMNRYQTDVCHGCFALSQNKRSRRLTLKAIEMQKTSSIDPPKKLLVYSRRKNRNSAPPPAPDNAFGAVVVRRKRSKLHANYAGVQWNHFHEVQVIYRQDKVLLSGQCNSFEGPQCTLCLQPYDTNSLYIGCEHCQGWFHGVALGITEGNITKVASFKCHKCRKKGGPLCPHRPLDTSMVSESKENFTVEECDHLKATLGGAIFSDADGNWSAAPNSSFPV